MPAGQAKQQRQPQTQHHAFLDCFELSLGQIQFSLDNYMYKYMYSQVVSEHHAIVAGGWRRDR